MDISIFVNILKIIMVRCDLQRIRTPNLGDQTNQHCYHLCHYYGRIFLATFFMFVNIIQGGCCLKLIGSFKLRDHADRVGGGKMRWKGLVGRDHTDTAERVWGGRWGQRGETTLV